MILHFPPEVYILIPIRRIMDELLLFYVILIQQH